MRTHVTVKFGCKDTKLGNKLRALSKELGDGNLSRIYPQQFPMLNTIYINPPKYEFQPWNTYKCNEFKYSKTYAAMTIYLSSEEDTIKATDDCLRAIIKELMDLTGLTEFKGAKISSTTTEEEYRNFKGLNALPEVTVAIGDGC